MSAAPSASPSQAAAPGSGSAAPSTPVQSSPAPLPRGYRIAMGLMLLIHAVLGLHAAARLSVTHDEYWHLPAGLLTWKTGRFDYDHLNPPLTRLWSSLPLLLTDARVDVSTPIGDLTALGDRFLADNRERYDTYFLIARGMNLAWSLLAALVLAKWSTALFGPKAACLSVALWCFCPTVLAHAALVTPDLGGASLFLITLYATWRCAREPGWKSAALSGALLGLAQLTKFTNILLYALVPLTWWLARRAAAAPGSWRATARCAAVVLVSSLLVLNAGYLFQMSFARLASYSFTCQTLAPLNGNASLGWLPVPLPRDFLEGLDHQRQIMEGGHPVYLDGEWSDRGFATYFAKALAYKLPHVTQALLLLALAAQRPVRRKRKNRGPLALLWLPVVVIVGVASTTGMQLGVRYILPAFPFLFLFAGQTGQWIDFHSQRAASLLVCAVAACLPLSLRYHPHHIAYFNEAAGGPVGGRRHLLDSNLDWGQDLRGLKQFLDARDVKMVGLAYFGMLPPGELGFDYFLPRRPAQPGWYAASVNFLEGRPHTIRNPNGSLRSAGYREFSWLGTYRPVARIGYSIDVFHITEDDLPRRPGPAGP